MATTKTIIPPSVATIATVVMDLVDNFAESHQDEVDSDHNGDGDEGCTYCAAIAAGRELLKELVALSAAKQGIRS